MNILVTYASKYGATQEIAERIGEVLRQAGLQVDILPVASIRNLAAYEAVILGSAIYVGKWHKEAETFLRTNEKVLAERNVSCPIPFSFAGTRRARSSEELSRLYFRFPNLHCSLLGGQGQWDSF